ncbi:MAG TPA: DUF4956 domain-containing protein [Gemmatimonadaceae bacterium]|nr:DUF4956 domain-containing protein [Gemmatimonadaceae bacterium]
MATANGRTSWVRRVTGSLIVRLVVYYAALVGAMVLVWRYLPRSEMIAHESLDALFGSVGGGLDASGGGRRARAAATVPLDQTTLAVTVALAMIASVLLALPTAWVYTYTRAKRGYQQSVVQTLIVLPLVVAGVVVLVKYSVALAFSLAGIVAAVRFRNTLDDSKDAVYIFLATAIGLASAVDLPVALVISVLFNGVALALWYSDFGRSAALDGRLAERRLARAMEQISRTGTFVARMDEQVFQDLSADQLAAVADRAWRRARRDNPETPDPEGRREALLRIRTEDVRATRLTIEPLLEEHLKRWRYGGVVHEPDGTHVVEYAVVLKRSIPADNVLELLRGRGAPIQAVELA